MDTTMASIIYLVVIRIEVDAARSFLDVRFNNTFLLCTMLSATTAQQTHLQYRLQLEIIVFYTTN